MVLAVQEDIEIEERAMLVWRCGGERRDGRRCTTLLMKVSLDFLGRLERVCPDCKEVRVRER